jgi:predicted heme/steroid binding protein
VYNWKNGKAYLGHEGEDVENITDWNVGAHQMSAYHTLRELLNIKLGAEKNG